jgi:uncharacterized membrane protein
MHYGALNSLNDILQNLKSDAATIGLTIASLIIIISTIYIMFDIDTNNVGAHTRRWDKVRIAFIGAAIIAAAGALVSFGQQLGGAIHV